MTAYEIVTHLMFENAGIDKLETDVNARCFFTHMRWGGKGLAEDACINSFIARIGNGPHASVVDAQRLRRLMLGIRAVCLS